MADFDDSSRWHRAGHEWQRLKGVSVPVGLQVRTEQQPTCIALHAAANHLLCTYAHYKPALLLWHACPPAGVRGWLAISRYEVASRPRT